MFSFRRKSSPDWDEIHQLFKQAALRQDRTDRQQDRTDRQLELLVQEQRERDRAWQAKLEENQAAQDKQRAAWEKQHSEAIKRLQEVAKQVQKEVGGMAYNLGNIAEEYFMQAWDDCEPVLIGDIEFDKVLANQKYRAHGREMECDLVLLNGTHIGLVEVKLTLHSKDVYEFDTKLKKVLPVVLPAEYRHLHVLPVMACARITDQARKEIAEYGFALLRPDGQKAKLEIEHLRTHPPIVKVLGS